jgi:hypothetical protein
MPVSVYTASGGDIEVHWDSDGREFPDGYQREPYIFAASLTAGAPPESALTVEAFQPSTDKTANVHPNETADVTRLRNYRAEIGG